MTLAVVETSNGPVIKRGDPGTEDNKFGFEGGSALKHEGLYHVFVSEMLDEPFWVKMRIAHWTSPDRRKWTRLPTIAESSGDRTRRCFQTSDTPVFREGPKCSDGHSFC